MTVGGRDRVAMTRFPLFVYWIDCALWLASLLNNLLIITIPNIPTYRSMHFHDLALTRFRHANKNKALQYLWPGFSGRVSIEARPVMEVKQRKMITHQSQFIGVLQGHVYIAYQNDLISSNVPTLSFISIWPRALYIYLIEEVHRAWYMFVHSPLLLFKSKLSAKQIKCHSRGVTWLWSNCSSQTTNWSFHTGVRFSGWREMWRGPRPTWSILRHNLQDLKALHFALLWRSRID